MLSLDLRVPRNKDCHSTSTVQIPHPTTPSATASTKENPKTTRQHSHCGMNFDLSKEGSHERTSIGTKILKSTPVTGASFSSISVNKDDILKAASNAKRYTSGGLQQITPWHLKRALLATSDEDCAIKAPLLATSWGRGDSTAPLGELVAEAKLIALFKDDKKIDVRPIIIGGSLRCLLTYIVAGQGRISRPSYRIPNQESSKPVKRLGFTKCAPSATKQHNMGKASFHVTLPTLLTR